MEKEEKLLNLKNNYIYLSEVREEVWKYHPSNKDFINPIKEYTALSEELKILEFKISELEREINSVN